MDHHTLLPAWGQAGLSATLASGAGLPVEGGSAFVLSEGPQPLLGIYAGIASGDEKSDEATRSQPVLRYALQATVRHLVAGRWYPDGGPLKRLLHCMCTPVGSTVDILHSPEFLAACYKGLQTCGSPWSCVHCAPKIAVRRREELRQAVKQHEERGGRLALLTYTLQHNQSDLLGNLVRSMALARRAIKSGRGSVERVQRFGILGTVRAFEITHGVNGWHPHSHELLFLAGPINLDGLVAECRVAWSRAVAAAGLRDVNEHGVVGTAADLSISGYLSKFGHDRAWGLESEVTFGAVKRGRLGSRSPVGLLLDYQAGDDPSGVLWLQFAETVKGLNQLVWSPGLKARFRLGPDLTDEQVAQQVNGAFSVLLASLTWQQWRVVLGNDARGEVLAMAAAGDGVQLWDYLAGLGVV